MLVKEKDFVLLYIFQWSVLPLVGNQPHYRNFYKITVFTGLRRWAGTKSNVYFILSGEVADTDVRELKDTRDRVNVCYTY